MISVCRARCGCSFRLALGVLRTGPTSPKTSWCASLLRVTVRPLQLLSLVPQASLLAVPALRSAATDVLRIVVDFAARVLQVEALCACALAGVHDRERCGVRGTILHATKECFVCRWPRSASCQWPRCHGHLP